MEQKIRFILKGFRNLGTKDRRFQFEAVKSIKWKEREVKDFTFILVPGISEAQLTKNIGKVIVLHNPQILVKVPSPENEKFWICLDIGIYNSRNDEIIHGYDDITFENLSWKDRDKKKILADGGAVIAFFVGGVLLINHYRKRKVINKRKILI